MEGVQWCVVLFCSGLIVCVYTKLTKCVVVFVAGVGHQVDDDQVDS